MKRSYAWTVGMALALGCGVAALAAPASAEPLLRDAVSEEDVEPSVQRGIELRRAGQDREALAVFEEALAQAPESARIKVHLASTHQALGQWPEAERYLAEVLSDSDDPYIRRHRATLERARTFVEGHLGSLDVVGEPAGAELFLSGRSIGHLPLAAPARVALGSYTLEVRKEGYHSVTRPVSIAGGALLRESVELGAKEAAPPAWSLGASGAEAGVEDQSSGSPRWLTWSLAGAGVVSGVVSVLAFGAREEHADNWNSAECLATGATRGEVCPDELEDGRDAERLGITTAVLSGALLGGAAVSFFLEKPDASEAPALSLQGCGLTGAGARCFGSF